MSSLPELDPLVPASSSEPHNSSFEPMRASISNPMADVKAEIQQTCFPQLVSGEPAWSKGCEQAQARPPLESPPSVDQPHPTPNMPTSLSLSGSSSPTGLCVMCNRPAMWNIILITHAFILPLACPIKFTRVSSGDPQTPSHSYGLITVTT